jgi:hypothetical protein
MLPEEKIRRQGEEIASACVGEGAERDRMHERGTRVVPLWMWMRRVERSRSVPRHSTPLQTASRGRWLGWAWLGVKPKPPIAPRSTPRRTKIKNKGKSKRRGNREIRSERSGREHDFRVSRARLSGIESTTFEYREHDFRVSHTRAYALPNLGMRHGRRVWQS